VEALDEAARILRICARGADSGSWEKTCRGAAQACENATEALDAASPVPAVADDPEPLYVWTIDYDNECYGIYATKEAAEEGLARQIAEGGPAWDACEVHQRSVAGPGSRDTKEPGR
jgi:hypothetical protein